MAGSVSSHLTPEPERRLWLILDTMKQAVDAADRRAAILVAFAAAELFFFKPGEYGGVVGTTTSILLAAALPLGIFAYSPISGKPNRMPLDPKEPHSVDDNLVTPEFLAKYSHSELIHRFDKYLGGGVTSTQYHEDIVGQIVVFARVATRKQTLLKILAALVALAQVGLFVHLI